MKRSEMITKAAADVAAAADFGQVGQVDVFGDAITAEHVLAAVASAIDRLQTVLDMTDAEWAAKWAASEADEARVEDDARKFAAGKA